MLTISVISSTSNLNFPMLVISDLTSLGSSVLGLSLQNATDSPGGDGGVLDIAEIIVQGERRAWLGYIWPCRAGCLEINKLSDHFSHNHFLVDDALV